MSRVDPSRPAFPELPPEPDDFTQLDAKASAAQPAPKNPCSPAEAVLVFRSRSDPSFSEVRCGGFAELESIRDHLELDVTNWRVGRDDVRAVHQQLERLAPDRYALALKVMEREGLLSRYVESFTSDERRAFLEQAATKGVAAKTTPPPPPSPDGAPPVPPRFDVPAGAPAPLRSAAYEHSREALLHYPADYRRAIDTYRERLRQVPDGAALRRLGPPPLPADLRALIDSRDSQARRTLDGVVGENKGIHRDATEAVGERLSQLRGEVGGAFAVKASIDLGTLVKWKHEVTLDKDRIVVSPEAARLAEKTELRLVRESLPRALRGKAVTVGVEADADGLSSVSAGFAKYGVSVDRDGTFEVTAPVAAGTKAYAKVRDGKFGGGVKTGVEGLSVSLGFEVNGLSKADAANVTGPYTAFDIPEELRAGKSMESLPPDLIRQLLDLGWTPREWTERQDALRAEGLL